MGDKTGIQWTESTWNPLRGCSRTIAEGAETSGCGDPTGGGCYAERNGYRFAGPGLPYERLVRMTAKGPRWTGRVDLVDKHLLDPVRWQAPRKIFTTSVSDPFHERLINEEIAVLVGVMVVTRRHTHQMLTKRAGRAREWFAWVEKAAAALGMSPSVFCYAQLLEYLESRPGVFSTRDVQCVRAAMAIDQFGDASPAWPPRNLWLMTSVEHQAAADDRIPKLIQVPAAVRGLSIEPMLGPVDLQPWLNSAMKSWDDAPIGWVIVGAESGPGARPCDLAWVRALRDQCQAAGVAFFVKQLVVDGKLRHDLADFPPDLRIREFPEVTT